MLPLLLGVVGTLALVGLFFGDWGAGGERAVQRQRVLRRWVLIVAAMLVLAYVVLVVTGSFATI